MSLVDGLQAQVQGQVSAITQQVNSIESFLSTYKEQQESLRQQITITKQQIASTKSTFDDTEAQTQLGIDTADSNYQQALSSKDTTLASLNNAIEQARIARNEAQTQLGKFTITSPIAGSIGEILVDIGQEVQAGTPLFSVVSTNEQQVEIALTEEEREFVQVGQEVIIRSNDNDIRGSIQSISTVADAAFTYATTISLEETTELFGDIVDVSLPIRTPYPLVPINVVTILSRNQGRITVWEDGDVALRDVEFGKVR